MSRYSRASWGCDRYIDIEKDRLPPEVDLHVTDIEQIRPVPTGVIRCDEEGCVTLCVGELKAGCTYDFRVCFINRDGPSDFSEGSKRFRTTPPHPPQVRVDGLYRQISFIDQAF